MIVKLEQMVHFGKYYIEFFWKGINKNINIKKINDFVQVKVANSLRYFINWIIDL